MNRKVFVLPVAAAICFFSVSCFAPAEESSTVSLEYIELTTAETSVSQPVETEPSPTPTPYPPLMENATDVLNEENIASLLTHLVYAYENPEEDYEASIMGDLDEIGSVSEDDYELLSLINECWHEVFLNPGYTLYLYGGGQTATELDGSGIPNSSAHAIVILGYELLNGQMQPELVGRLDAAAALARSYPETVIVCSGGVTGANNTVGNTEAGLMRDYLVDNCGIDPARIFTDERALTTADNAVNTFAIMQENNITSMTIVTSVYHMRWGLAVYNAVGNLYRLRRDYNVEVIANYCYDIEPSVDIYSRGDRFAAFQIGDILGLSEPVIRSLPSVYG